MIRPRGAGPRRVVLVVVGAIILAACGGADGRFDASADDVRTAIDARDRDAAIAAVDALAVEGLAAHQAGALDDAELDDFARRIESLRVQIDAVLPPPPPPATTTTVDTDDDDDDHGDDGRKKGRGNKRDSDDED